MHVKVSAPIHINDYLQIINKKYVYGQKLDNIIFNSLPDRLKEFIKYKILKNYNLYFQKKNLLILNQTLFIEHIMMTIKQTHQLF